LSSVSETQTAKNEHNVSEIESVSVLNKKLQRHLLSLAHHIDLLSVTVHSLTMHSENKKHKTSRLRLLTDVQLPRELTIVPSISQCRTECSQILKTCLQRYDDSAAADGAGDDIMFEK
jgi:hypothetical protein